jgi:hypothetical protein
VSDTIATSGWRTSGAPASSPWPKTTFRTPAGRCSAQVSASIAAVIGVCSLGFRTTVLPAASAGPIFQIAIMSG